MDELYEYMSQKLAEMYESAIGNIYIDSTHAFRIYHLICNMKQIRGIVNQEDDMWNQLRELKEGKE